MKMVQVETLPQAPISFRNPSLANNYNSNPILINVDISTGWRSNQTLNVGNLPSNAQQLSGAVPRQPGIRPYRIQVVSNGVTVAGLITVADPNDANTFFWQAAVPATAGPAGTIIIDEVFDNTRPTWRDFKVTGVTATVTQLQIWYRI